MDLFDGVVRSRKTARMVLCTSSIYDSAGGDYHKLQGLAMLGESSMMRSLDMDNYNRSYTSGKTCPSPSWPPILINAGDYFANKNATQTAEMSRKRASLIDSDSIAELCDACGLTSLLFTSHAVAGKKVKVCALRGLVGAVDHDSGGENVDALMRLLNVIQ